MASRVVAGDRCGVSRGDRAGRDGCQLQQPDPLGVTRIGWVGRPRVNRLDFGVVGSKSWNNELAPRRFAIGPYHTSARETLRSARGD